MELIVLYMPIIDTATGTSGEWQEDLQLLLMLGLSTGTGIVKELFTYSNLFYFLLIIEKWI